MLSSSDLKNTKNQKQHFRLFSDSYESTRRAVRCKRIVRTRRVFFVKMSNLTKSTFYGPGPRPTGPIWAHGPWPMGPWALAQNGPIFNLFFMIFAMKIQNLHGCPKNQNSSLFVGPNPKILIIFWPVSGQPGQKITKMDALPLPPKKLRRRG